MFWKWIAFASRALFSLRYSVEVRGLEELNGHRFPRRGGILFLPNHTAYIDAPLFFPFVWPAFRMRPLAVEAMYRHPLLHWLMRRFNALSIPDFDTSINQVKVWRAEQSLQAIARGLSRGENFILYPSGRLKTSGKESLGGTSAVHSLLQQCPDANVVLVRTSGLWGSQFSRAIEGRSPDLKPLFWKSLKILLKNGIFFAPRRKVVIEICREPLGFPRENSSRIDCNRYLEDWYNQYLLADGERTDEEPLEQVSYAFWKRQIPELFSFQKKNAARGRKPISTPVQEAVFGKIREILESPELGVEEKMSLANDLGMDSLNVAELIAFLHQKFGVGEIHPGEIETVRDALEWGQGLRSQSKTPTLLSSLAWPEEKGRPSPQFPNARTIAEAFLRSALRMGSLSACSDAIVGVYNYRQLKRNVLILAGQFRKIPGERVGVLLPASVGAYATFLALQFAGKVPVMLNWTLGPKALEEMVRASGAERVITSWRFLDNVSYLDVGSVVERLDFLEDLRNRISLGKKLQGLYRSYLPVESILKAYHLQALDPDTPAVILFTSGTEAAPKGIPLSHTNLLKNLESGFSSIELYATDVVYGILPPFHSFGLTVAGIISFLTGLRITFYPDPTDSFALAEGIVRWKVSIFCSAPSFLKGLLSAASPKELSSVRYFITGAEKTPKELYDAVQRLGSILIEGYGTTECSPMLTMNRPYLPPRGVGRPLPGVSICTVHPETQEPLPPGKEGEICVRGPNVFRGYLNSPQNPFVEIDGQLWYRTGDLGYLDSGGNLILSGRLKRFTKVGGEMVSLGAVEEAIGLELLRRHQAERDHPAVAVCADAAGRLLLYTTVPLAKEEANEMLRASGLSRLVKVAVVKRVEQIPVTGTGKTDYRKLQSAM